MASALIVPPGGFAGFRQMTPASQRALFSPARASGRRRKKKQSTRRVRARAGARAGARSSRKRKLKFGSPAWRKKYLKK